MFAAQERIAITECQHRTLDALDDLADKSKGTLVIRNTPVSRNREWGSAAWDAAVASGAIEHMPHDTRRTSYSTHCGLRSPVIQNLNIRQQEL